MKKFLKIAFKSDVLIRIMLLLMFAQGSLASHAQTIGIIEPCPQSQ